MNHLVRLAQEVWGGGRRAPWDTQVPELLGIPVGHCSISQGLQADSRDSTLGFDTRGSALPAAWSLWLLEVKKRSLCLLYTVDWLGAGTVLRFPIYTKGHKLVAFQWHPE
jgi:hypothetical protein